MNNYRENDRIYLALCIIIKFSLIRISPKLQFLRIKMDRNNIKCRYAKCGYGCTFISMFFIFTQRYMSLALFVILQVSV